MRKLHENIWGIGHLIWVILGIGLCIESIKLDLGNFREPGPGFMPFLSGGVIGVCGLILILISVLKRSGEEKELVGKKIWLKENWKRVLFILLAMLGYGLFLELLGFVITTFIFLFLLFKITEPEGWLRPLVFSGAWVIISYFVFVVWLMCQFPRGVFGF